ncbi:MAG: hypothetical protein ACTSV7_00185, partial [Candidatus Baldrarchaeia archaeon]
MKSINKILPLMLLTCLFLIIFLASTYLVKFTKLVYISQIDLRAFCVLLSLSISISLWYFVFEGFSKEMVISIDRNRLVFVFALLLVASLFMFIANYGDYRSYGCMVYLPWMQIPIFLLISSIFLYGAVLYIPAYLLHRIVFRACKMDLLTKAALYPAITMLIFGFVGFLPIKDFDYFKFLVPSLIIACIFIMLIDNFTKRKEHNNKASEISINLKELLMLIFLILFRLFLQFSAAGGINAFLRGDASRQAWNVAFISKYGIYGYVASPLTERYSMFFFAAWSTLTQLLPLPYCNTLVLTEFFNQIFTTLTFYIFARTLLGRISKSLFATLVLTLASGFSWLYVLTDPPSSFLSANDIYDYFWKIFNKFGASSGAPMSTIYADDHALVRLWSLGLSFGFATTLLRAYKDFQSRKLYLMVALACFVQIALGHTTEIILINVVIATFMILTKLQSFKEILAMLGSSILISEIIALILSYSTLSLVLIASPFLICTLVAAVKKISDENEVKWRLSLQNKTALLNTLAMLFIFYYSLSWIAFLSNYHRVWVRVPLVNLWYVFPIEWGFSGFLFLLTVIKILSIKQNNVPYYLKYAFLAFLMLFAFIVSVDCINAFLVYTYVTNPLIPIYFIPFFALASAFLIENLTSAKIEKFKRAFILSFLIILLILASFNHIISASYWGSRGWRYETSPSKTLSSEEIQLANMLYSIPRSLPLEMCAYLPASDPIPEVDEVTYQKMVRYPIYDEDYIILLSGFKIPQKVANDVLYKAQSIYELIFLKQFYPLNYLIVEKNSTSFLARFLSENETPIFEGQRYFVYDISHLKPAKSYDLTADGFIVVDKVKFKGNVTLSSDSS